MAPQVARPLGDVRGSFGSGREGVEQSALRKLIADYGLDYSDADLLLIRDALVADGLIEVIAE